MTRLRFIAAAAALAVTAFAGLGVALAAGPAAVTIDNFAFSPATITVPVGATVTWTNGDDIPHTVRASDGSFHSAVLDSGDHYSFTFTRPGVYSYFCSIHPMMVGKVIVH